MIYAKITGYTPDPRDPSSMQAILNDVAHAVSNIVPVYAADDGATLPVAISHYDLIQGKFIQGAHMFRTRDGGEIAKLTVQRRDMYTVITVLKSARITFGRPEIGQRP